MRPRGLLLVMALGLTAWLKPGRLPAEDQALEAGPETGFDQAATEQGSDESPSGASTGEAGAPAKAYKPVEVAALPYPTNDPTLGLGINVLGIAAIRRTPQDNRPITVAAAGMATVNGSWAAAGGVRAPLDDDRIRLLIGGGFAHINSNFYGIGYEAGQRGAWIPLSQDASVGLAGVLFRTIDNLYIGPRVSVSSVKTRVDVSGLSIPPSLAGYEVASEDRTETGGVQIEYDDRDSTFYPTRGWYVTTSGVVCHLDRGLVLTGQSQDLEYGKASLSVDHYWLLTPKGVLAAQVNTEYRTGHAPIYALARLGSSLRGYVSTQFQDKTLITAQAEYRYDTGWHRIGVTGFAGVGAIAEDYEELWHTEASQLLPAVGAGLRWTMAPENHINLRLDGVYGREGAVWYLSVGEAF